jgi:hypothetical protein
MSEENYQNQTCRNPMSDSERILFWLFPERTGLSDLYHNGYHFSGVFLLARDPIEIHPSAEVRPGKKLYKVEERNDPFRCGGIEPSPVSYVLFRPEEIHGASGIRSVLKPLPEGNCHIPNHILRLCPQNDSIPDLHLKGLSTIQARRIDLNRLSGKKPANCQRFKCSLPEPFLLSINGNTILGGEVIKRSEGGYEICIRKEPSRNPGCEKFVENLSAFLHRDTQFGCNLCVVRSLTGLYHLTHYDMECSLNLARFTHGFTPLESPAARPVRNFSLLTNRSFW